MRTSDITSSVAVLILNYNQWEMTIECVESVLQSDYAAYKIFLMDNGSHNQIDFEKMKSVESDKCELFRIDPNRGYVGGMNFGLEQASAEGFDFFLVMNNDAIIAPDAISNLVEVAKRYSNKCIVTGKVYHYDRPNVLQFIGSRIMNQKTLKMQRLLNDEIDNGQWDKEIEMDMIDDIFWLLPKTVYEQVGGYSPYFWFNAEQADLALRAVKAGNKLIYTPDAKLWHKGSVTIGGRVNNPKLTYYTVQSTLIFKFIHLTGGRFILFYLKTYKNAFVSSAKYLVKKLLGRHASKNMIIAQFKALAYFNSWIFTKKENNGKTPFDN